MTAPLLLDTCAAIWLSEDATIASEAKDALTDAARNNVPTYISPMTAWEIGSLVSRGRLKMSMSPEAWFEQLLLVPGIFLTGLTPRILVASSFLPGSPPRDPADRILIATARDSGLRLITRDKHLLAYAQEGHIAALEC